MTPLTETNIDEQFRAAELAYHRLAREGKISVTPTKGGPTSVSSLAYSSVRRIVNMTALAAVNAGTK